MKLAPHASRVRLLDAALQVVRTKGYTATTVDDICHGAGVTKGSFFHHFKGKEDLALAAIEHWNAVADNLFASAPYQQLADPRDRVFGYVDFRAEILRGALFEFTCLLGTMVQETYATHPAIRDACNGGIFGHAATVAEDIAQAKVLYAPDADWRPESVASFTQAAIQGAFFLAKAQDGPEIAAQCVGHLRRYLEMLLNYPAAERRTP